MDKIIGRRTGIKYTILMDFIYENYFFVVLTDTDDDKNDTVEITRIKDQLLFKQFNTVKDAVDFIDMVET